MAAILLLENNEMPAISMFQTNPVGVRLFSYVKKNKKFCSDKFA